MFDTNSFSGTIDLERKTNTGAANIGEWQVVESYTASAEKVAQSATQREYRLNASTVNSGTAEFELSAGADGSRRNHLFLHEFPTFQVGRGRTARCRGPRNQPPDGAAGLSQSEDSSVLANRSE